MREPWDLTRDFVQMMSNQAAADTNAGDNALMQIFATNANRKNAQIAQGYAMDTLGKRNEYATQADTTAYDRQLARDNIAYTHRDADRIQDRGWAVEDDTRNNQQAFDLAKANQQMYAEREWAALHPNEPYGGGTPRRYGGDGGGGGPLDAASVLRKFEGFRSDPYWDVNALRTGYGSDTFTDPTGGVHRVTAGTRVTRQDAERDLARRAQQHADVAARQVGPDVWASLPPNISAALTSVAYNYGSLPTSVAEAVKSGDAGTIARAVAGLASHNGGVNAKRRIEEANIISGGGEGFVADNSTSGRRYGANETGDVASSILNIPVSNSGGVMGGGVVGPDTAQDLASRNLEAVARVQLNAEMLKQIGENNPEMLAHIEPDMFHPYDKNNPMYVITRERPKADVDPNKPATQVTEGPAINLKATPRKRFVDGRMELDQIALPDK